MRRVIPPDLTFDVLGQILAEQGWKPFHLSGLLPPLIDGEPEQARFERGTESLTYSFNPVIRLRVLDGDTDSAQPSVTSDEVMGWLASQDPRVQARGCISAAELGLGHLLPIVREVAAGLPAPLMPIGQTSIRRLTPLPKGNDTGMFEALPAALKSGVLRQLALDNPVSAAQIIPMCWHDGAELALSAMIFSARFGLTNQTLNIRRLDLEGLTRGREMAEMFRAAKMACLATLEGQMPGDDDNPRNRFWRLVLGQTSEISDVGFFITALTMPLPDMGENADEIFSKITPIPHALGHSNGKGFNNPPRIWTPQSFEISRTVESSSQTREPLLTCDPLAVLAVQKQDNLRLPTAQEWEAATRGPDGRFQCWGMTAVRPAVAISPWGLLWSGLPEWTVFDGELVISGSDPSGRVSYVRRPKDAEKAAIRLARPVT